MSSLLIAELNTAEIESFPGMFASNRAGKLKWLQLIDIEVQITNNLEPNSGGAGSAAVQSSAGAFSR